MKVLKYWFTIVFSFTVIAVFSSCELEEGDYPTNIKPPLGLTADVITKVSQDIISNKTITNVITNGNRIKLEFKAFNDEYYIEGYAIYVADNLSDLTNEKSQKSLDDPGTFRRAPNNTDSSNNLTILGSVATEVLTFTYYMTNDVTNKYTISAVNTNIVDTTTNITTNGTWTTELIDLTDGQEYYFYVKTYGEGDSFSVWSLPSNITNIVYSTNYTTTNY